MNKTLSVRKPKPARYPTYTIESEAGQVLASVPILTSGNSHQLALVMAAAPALREFAGLVLHYADVMRPGKHITAGQWEMLVKQARAVIAAAERTAR